MVDAVPVIDFHAHILPQADHGCSSIHECRSQLSLMSKYGTDIAVATPHFYPQEHEMDVFLAKVDAAEKKLQENSLTDSPKILFGAEVLLYPNLHKMNNFESLCIRGTKTLLLELPTVPLGDAHYDTVEAMLDMDITVVLAHIDRYLGDLEDEIDTLISMGALAQINAYSLYSRHLRKKIFKYIEQTDAVCAIGSDLHGVDVSAYKKFAKAPKILGEYYADIQKKSYDLLFF